MQLSAWRAPDARQASLQRTHLLKCKLAEWSSLLIAGPQQHTIQAHFRLVLRGLESLQVGVPQRCICLASISIASLRVAYREEAADDGNFVPEPTMQCALHQTRLEVIRSLIHCMSSFMEVGPPVEELHPLR